MSPDSARGKSVPIELAASVTTASPRTADSESVAPFPAVDPLARIEADGVSAASRAVPLSPAVKPARAATLAAEPAPVTAGSAPVDQQFTKDASYSARRQPVGIEEPAMLPKPTALPKLTAPAKPAIHIGAIEVHVTPPPAPPRVPAARVGPRTIARKAPLSRGYLSRYGWDQA